MEGLETKEIANQTIELARRTMKQEIIWPCLRRDTSWLSPGKDNMGPSKRQLVASIRGGNQRWEKWTPNLTSMTSLKALETGEEHVRHLGAVTPQGCPSTIKFISEVWETTHLPRIPKEIGRRRSSIEAEETIHIPPFPYETCIILSKNFYELMT